MLGSHVTVGIYNLTKYLFFCINISASGNGMETMVSPFGVHNSSVVLDVLVTLGIQILPD